jgi:S-adenosylmethionine:tRNA ribosyltransferase-isomerase
VSDTGAGTDDSDLQVVDFDYALPDDLIAQAPPPRRDASRLLVLDRTAGRTTQVEMGDLPRFLRAGDVLVVNNTRVFPARLLGQRVPSGGAVECLLLGRLADGAWDALVHPGQKLRPGTRFRCAAAAGALRGEVMSQHTFGRRHVRLEAERGGTVEEIIEGIGHVPLPPYIRRPDAADDRERYQAVFASVTGSVAAPTASLHFTPALLDEIEAMGVERIDITLHVGYGTFKPVRAPRVVDHTMEAETFEITPEAATRLEAARHSGRRIVAVGTTVTRALESAARDAGGALLPGRRSTSLFIYPGFRFAIVGALLTNFHVPRSSLLMLVCAFAGRDRVLEAYREAIAARYRFYSYGDAMFIA